MAHPIVPSNGNSTPGDPGDGFFGAFYTSSKFLVNVLHPVSMSAPPGDPVVVNRCQAIYINYLSLYITGQVFLS
jgi:hypothetical protein